jgi:nucleoside-diphosphate-sugar epimerase
LDRGNQGVKVLILGGTGLISTATTRALLERGAEVTHYNRGRRSREFDGRVTTVTGDRYDHAAFERHMAELPRFDCVIEMIGYSPEDARSLVRAFTGKTGHLIFCSTVDVYARPVPRYPIPEDVPLGGRNDYGRNKVLCENLLTEAADRGDFPLTILRPAHTYDDGGAILHSFGWGTAWVDRLRKGKPIIVHGDGTSLWSVCHADDIGPAFAAAAGNPTAFGKAYNVAGEEWITWNEMYAQAATVLRTPAPRLLHVPTDLLLEVAPKYAHILAENFMFNNIFDNTAAKSDLGFAYTIPFTEGVRRVVGGLDARQLIQNSDEQTWYDTLAAAYGRIGASLPPVAD